MKFTFYWNFFHHGVSAVYQIPCNLYRNCNTKLRSMMAKLCQFKPRHQLTYLKKAKSIYMNFLPESSVIELPTADFGVEIILEVLDIIT